MTIDSVNSPCRPQSHATLLEMIQTVLWSNDGVMPSCSIHPVTQLDLPSTILTKWGIALPWSWRIWKDARLHNSEVAESLSATWLYHLDASVDDIHMTHSVEWWDLSLVRALEGAAGAALSMISRLLLCVVRFMKEQTSQSLDSPTLDVVLKACWATKHLLQTLEAAVDDTTSSTLYTIMHKLFLLLGDARPELDVKDLILEGFSYSNTGLRLSMGAIVADSRSECASGWEHKLGQLIKLLNAVRLSGGVISMLDLRNIRQTLQLLTLAGRTGLVPCPTSGMVRQFLSAVLAWLDGSEEIHSPIWSMLGDVTIMALAVWRQHVVERGHTIPKSLGRDLVWSLFEEVDPLNLPLAASLAAYISATARDRGYDDLSYSEACNYFRDVILLVLNREYGGIEEPLSLVVAPAVSRALVELSQHPPSRAKRSYISSPWTISMVAHLKRLERNEELADKYDEVLWKLLKPHARPLCFQTESPDCDDARMGKVWEDTSVGSVFYWSGARPCIIQV
ncbi:hypothetical protein C8Q79DRAFT_54612 [Trametes meyenii]|nr:hypothetical protein C8Q79DRAFT_54612 [Trametes meyenii]